MVDVLSSVNSKIVGAINVGTILSGLGWLVLGILVIGAIFGGYLYWNDRKKFNKIVTMRTIVNGRFVPAGKDRAKVTKIGKGGFEILYLKKLKTWKIAHISSKVDANTYEFFIMPDGYWYTGYLSADMKMMDATGGLITVVTTNPLMRAQYTALEKQIDTLSGDKKTFWDKYGQWVMTLSFILIIGVLAWLIYREMATTMGGIKGVADQMTQLANSLNKLTVNLNNAQGNNGGLVPSP